MKLQIVQDREFLYLQPAHRVGLKLESYHAVDARSLFDAIQAPAPVLNDKRTLVSIRAIQESVSARQLKWLPTQYQFSDCLTKVSKDLRDVFRRWLQIAKAVLTESDEAKAYAQSLGIETNGKRKNTSESFELNLADRFAI